MKHFICGGTKRNDFIPEIPKWFHHFCLGRRTLVRNEPDAAMHCSRKSLMNYPWIAFLSKWKCIQNWKSLKDLFNQDFEVFSSIQYRKSIFKCLKMVETYFVSYLLQVELMYWHKPTGPYSQEVDSNEQCNNIFVII